MADPVDELVCLIRTRHALVTVRTADEAHAERMIREAAGTLQMPVMAWSLSTGLCRTAPDTGGSLGGTNTLEGALRFMRGNDASLVYVLKDSLQQAKNPACLRLMRDVAAEYAHDRRTMFLIDAAGALPESLQTMSVPFELPLPDAEEIYRMVKREVRQLSGVGEVAIDMSKAELEQFLANLRGLSRVEIAQVVAEAVLGDGRLDADDVDRAMEAKRTRLGQTGVLDYIPVPEDFPSAGGMGHLQRWLSIRAKALTPEARMFGLEPPRGILLLGVQGCGKSLMARFVGASWRMPLLRMDVGSLYDKFVGETERRLRTAFEVTSAMAPCVLWIDEIEKAFASAGAGAAGAVSDGGLSQRMFGQLLTWMQDHTDPVFLVATANDVSALPPELMRKGRFDEVFFVDLPSADARKQIIEIHLARRKRDPKKFDLDVLAAKSDGFSGAEIEQAIVSALYAAFAGGGQLTTEDIAAELAGTQPLSVLMAERVAELRAWAKTRCVPAD